MSTQFLFKEFVALFKSWPVDAAKTGRCLGQHLRTKFSLAFRHGELSEKVDNAHWSKVLDDLKPIANNEFMRKYPRDKQVGALGISSVECGYVLSNEGLKEINKGKDE